MEYRKELPEKSKKLIAKQFKSDILNKSTGYYKTENIFPVTSKPNELKINLKKFEPHFKEVKAVDRYFNNLLSDKQRNNSFILKHKRIPKSRNQELEIIRKRAKTIKDSCYDRKGNFSCRRRYMLEFYGIDKLNNTYDFNDVNNINNNININIIKDDDRDNRDINNDKNNEKVKGEEKEIENYNYNKKNNENVNKFRKPRNKLKELILKSRNSDNDNVYNQENSTIKPTYEERFNTVNNDNNDLNNSFFNNMNERLYNKISRNKNQIENHKNESTLLNNEILENTIANVNINNPQRIYNRLKTDIHLPGIYLNTTQNIYQKKPRNFFHSKDISKLFYTKSNNPVKNIRLKRSEINKEDKQQYTLEFKLEKNDESLLDKLNQKNIKEIFHNNGLHLYDINEDKMNSLRIQKKLEGKLRKEKNDENFDNNYKKVIKILEKKGIKVDNIPINNEKGYESKIIVKKKRRGTPGKILYDNRFHKDENTKINTGKNNFFKSNNNKLIPQYDRNYKNLFKYKTKIYKQKKIK